jgi:hypothetical protein
MIPDTMLISVMSTGRTFTGKLPMPWYEDVSQIGTEACLFPVGYGMDTAGDR